MSKIRYRKEVAPVYNNKQRVIIRFDHYGCTVAGIRQLVKVAKADFPEVNGEDIEIVQYGGRTIAHFFGIEFDVPAGDARLEGYTQLYAIHMTR